MDKSGKIGYNGGMRYKKSVFRSLAMVTQLGLCVLTPTLIGIAAGVFLDSRFGTKTTLVLLVLGVLGGGRGAYLMAKRLIEREAREDRKEREKHLEEVLAAADRSVSRPKRPSRIRTGEEQKTETCGSAGESSGAAPGRGSTRQRES